MHPDASEWTQMHPSRSEQVRTGPNRSENSEKPAKTSKESQKIAKKIAIPRLISHRGVETNLKAFGAAACAALGRDV